jgi:type II secretion system protein I
MEVQRLGVGPQSCRDQQGFMYVEVLVGMAVLAFALLSIIPMFVMAARTNGASSDMTFAATLMHDKAEELRLADFDTLTTVNAQETLKMRAMSFQRTWSIQEDTPHPGMKTITVSVRPVRKDKLGSPRPVQVRFYRVQ